MPLRRSAPAAASHRSVRCAAPAVCPPACPTHTHTHASLRDKQGTLPKRRRMKVPDAGGGCDGQRQVQIHDRYVALGHHLRRNDARTHQHTHLQAAHGGHPAARVGQQIAQQAQNDLRIATENQISGGRPNERPPQAQAARPTHTTHTRTHTTSSCPRAGRPGARSAWRRG